GVIRRAVPVLPGAGGGHIPSLALAALVTSAGYSREELSSTLAGDAATRIAVPVRARAGGAERSEPLALTALSDRPWRIDYTGPAGTFTSFPSRAIHGAARSGATPDADNPFHGKVVFVGATFQESRDFYSTPVGRMAGVEVHANIANTLLARRTLLAPPWGLNLAMLIGTCVAVSLLSLWLRPLWVTTASLALVVVFALVSY